MNPKYFKDRIFKELDDSYEYIKKSLDSTKIDLEWSNVFKLMSDDSYRHAVELYKMFMRLYAETKDQDNYMNSIRDVIIEQLSAMTQKIEGYKATYDLISSSEEMSDERDTTNSTDS